jgi:hypothetical protein
MSTAADAQRFFQPPRVGGISWTAARLRALRHGLWFAAFAFALAGLGWVLGDLAGVDAHAYWASWRNGLYSAAPEQRDAYLYSPVFAEALWPLTLLSWPVFYALWMIAATASYAWLLAPLGRRWATPLLFICFPEIVFGNVWPFFALVLVLGLRRPGLWAFPILLKLTPAVGLLWFVTRREWRATFIAALATLAIAGLSIVVAPHFWLEWWRLLLHPADFTNASRATLRPLLHFPAAIRLGVGLPISVALTIYAARSNRPRLLAPAMLFASPVLGLNTLALLTAIPRLSQAEGSHDSQPKVSPGR